MELKTSAVFRWRQQNCSLLHARQFHRHTYTNAIQFESKWIHRLGYNYYYTHICTHSYTQQQSKYNRIIETKPATKWSIGLVCFFAILLLLYLYLNFTSFICEGNVAFHIWRTTYFWPSVYAFYCVHVNVLSMLELRLTLVLGGEGVCVRDSG